MDWQALGLASGATLMGVAGLQAAGAAWLGKHRRGAARRRCAARQQHFNQQLHAMLQWARAAKPIFKAWSGTRQFRVAAVVDEALDCKSFYLVPADGHPLPRFEPGQFLTFSLPLDPRQKPLVRCYSLSERPREDYYRVTIKLARPRAAKVDLPLGKGSSFFHERLAVGATLEAQAPQGAFFLDPTNTRPVVLIGAGIGITPLLSMISQITHERSGRRAFVFAGFGNSSEQPFREHLQQLAAEHDIIELDISYSRPMPSDVAGREYHHRGYVDIARLREVLPSSNYDFYVCGPPAMMESLVPALRDWGVPEEHIHFEAFGPASVRSTANVTSEQPCRVEFSRSGQTLTWCGDYPSLLEMAEAEGVALDYGCRAGNCGQCLLQVSSGEVKYVKQPGMPLEPNQCLTCIAIPSGDVVLEA